MMHVQIVGEGLEGIGSERSSLEFNKISRATEDHHVHLPVRDMDTSTGAVAAINVEGGDHGRR